MNPIPSNLQDSPAPPFTPQPPKPGLGVLRTILLALMVFVGTVELLLFGGLYLALSSPGTLPWAGVSAGQSSSGSAPRRQTGQAIPVSGTPAQAAPANPNGQ